MSKSAIVDKLLHTGREWRNLRLTLSSWNTCGLSQERLDYVLLDRAYDVSVLNELHGAHTLRASRNFITCGEPKAGDPAAGVGIALSNKAASLCYDSGHIGARIVWVKLRGFTCDMCVVGVYIPHRFRKRAPFQTDTLQELREFLHTIPSSMQVVVAGDFNAKLARNMEGIVGKYAMHPRCDEGGSELASIMRETDLVAASTYFLPKASQSLGNAATYVNSKSQAKQTASQINYILVSGRRKSSVLKCGTAWSAAIHRYG